MIGVAREGGFVEKVEVCYKRGGFVEIIIDFVGNEIIDPVEASEVEGEIGVDTDAVEVK